MRNRKRVCLSFDKQIYDNFKTVCAELELPISQAVEKVMINIIRIKNDDDKLKDIIIRALKS